MRFVIIGEAEEAAAVGAAVHNSHEHSLGPGCVTGSLAESMAAQGLTFPLVDSPEEAILSEAVDVVVVSYRDADQSMAMCRQASQADRHVIVIPPDRVSTAFSFELHLLLDESQYGIIPLSGRWFQGNDGASQNGTGSVPSDIKQLMLELPLSRDVDARNRMQLFGIDVLAACGTYSQITAMDLRGSEGKSLSRTITLAASEASDEECPPAILTLNPDQPDSGETLVRLLSRDGKETTKRLRLPWVGDAITDSDGQDDALASNLVCQLQDADACQTYMEGFSNSLELLAGLEKSLRRRRTVDVYFDAVSERGAFKTQMTAIGCGVLTYVIFGLVAFLVVAQLTSLPPLVLEIGRILWITPVILFLLAQLLLPLARERRSGTQQNASGDVRKNEESDLRANQ